MSEPTPEPPEYDVYPAIDGTRPVEPLPKSNAHMAPVRPVLESEGVATSYPEASPTGLPVIPPKAVPYAVATVGVAAVVQQVAEPGSVVAIVAAVLVAVGAALGIASPGLRRKP